MRSISTTFRSGIEDPNNPDPPIVFVTLEHEDWDNPYYFNWDVKDYILDGTTYIGFPFELVLLSDSEGAPEGSLTIQNVDRRIGEAIKPISGDIRATVEIYSSADFDLTVDPRVALGTPSRAYRCSGVYLREIACDAMAIAGVLRSHESLQEPYPSKRAVSSLLPGLYM